MQSGDICTLLSMYCTTNQNICTTYLIWDAFYKKKYLGYELWGLEEKDDKVKGKTKYYMITNQDRISCELNSQVGQRSKKAPEAGSFRASFSLFSPKFNVPVLFPALDHT